MTFRIVSLDFGDKKWLTIGFRLAFNANMCQYQGKLIYISVLCQTLKDLIFMDGVNHKW